MHNEDVMDKEVFDLNGHRIGHVTLARETGDFVLFDVELAPRARAHLHEDIVTLSSDDVLATDFDVTVGDDWDHLMDPLRAASGAG